MDEFLANLYNTNGFGAADEMDVEKLAQAELLTKIAEESGIDLDSLSDEQVAAVASEAGLDFGDDGDAGDYEVFSDWEGNEYAVTGDEEGNPYILGEDNQWYPAADLGFDIGSGDEGMEVEASARFEEADFLGRVMAHSYHDEHEKIAKSISEAEAKAFAKEVQKGGKAAPRLLQPGPASARTATPGTPGGASVAGMGYSGGRQATLLDRARSATRAKARSTHHRVGGLGHTVSKLVGKGLTGGKAKALGYGLLAAGGTAAGYGGYRGIKAIKEASVNDSLISAMAQDRAVNFLAQYDLSEHGFDFEPVEEVKVASPVVNEHVDELATQMLIDEGFGGLLQ
ncbi:MAG TPA: hypothetical protein VM537_15525 [Anaerolineae bacterium]|nr:hypothetical protein [Anaerolineae bacterium]